jgi:hypothetical protein
MFKIGARLDRAVLALGRLLAPPAAAARVIAFGRD